MTPKEFQKSNLTVELKAGKKRLEDALRGLSDEQCERAGATRSGSVTDLLSEIVTNEFLALMEVPTGCRDCRWTIWRMRTAESRLPPAGRKPP